MLGALRNFYTYSKRNVSLPIGLFILTCIVLFWLIGLLFVDPSHNEPLSAPPNLPPSMEYPLGTERQGKDLLAVMVTGIPLTLQIGLLAGGLGVLIGVVLGFTSAYYGGLVDVIIRGVTDVFLTIPPLVILILIAVSIQGGLSINQMALIVAAVSWVWPTRAIRSQVLSLRERAYVRIARLNGMGNIEIIVKELMPNMLPYIGASMVGAVASAVLASIGLSALGLGSMESPDVGMTIYWVIFYSALITGMWWWWIPPMILVILLFVGLFLVSAGLDEVANPRVRKSE